MAENTELNQLQRRLHDAHESSARLRARIEELEEWVEEGKINGARCAEERDRLQDAIRTLRDAKGDAANQDAYEEMIALLPENDEMRDGERKATSTTTDPL